MAKLPKNIVFYCRQGKDNYQIDGTNRWVTNVYNSFPTDEKCAESTKEVATRWCEGYGRCSSPVLFTESNDPIYNVQIIGLDNRGQGGKVYKAIVHNKYYVDLYPQHLLDLMIHGHIVDGVIKSPMVFVRCQGGLKLMRVNSKDYTDAINDVKKPKTIKTNELIEGMVYPSWRYCDGGVFLIKDAYVSTRTDVKLVGDAAITFNPNFSNICYEDLEIQSATPQYTCAIDLPEKITGDISAKYREIIEYYANFELIDHYVEKVEMYYICRIVAILHTVDASKSWPTINARLAKLYDTFMNNRR